MSKKIKFCGREFELKVLYEAYGNDKILPKQKEALNLFVDTFSQSLECSKELKKYIVEHDGDMVHGEIDNIFKYVIPVSLFVKRNEQVVIMCNYKFDMENGLGIVYEDGCCEKVLSQDDII